MILRSLLGDQESGFYVDVGAHHPRRFSNTCHFSLKGWRGINIDANPTAIEALAAERPDDVNITMGVGAEAGELDFHFYFEPALNTFDPALRRQRALENPEYAVSHVEKVRIQPLRQILREHLTAGQRIDFLSVDVEGKDLEVLKSNDWAEFRPRYVLVESLGERLERVGDTRIFQFLSSQGYVGLALTPRTIVFGEKNERTIA